MIPPEIRNDNIKTAIINAHASTLPNHHDEDTFTLLKKDSKQIWYVVL